MNIIRLHKNFDLEVDKNSGISAYPSFLPEEKDYFLNVAAERLIKTRYSGLNVHKTGFQHDQKRSDDFRTLTARSTIVTDTPYYNIYVQYKLNDRVMYKGILFECLVDESTVGPFNAFEWSRVYIFKYNYPSDYLIGLGEAATIAYFTNVGVDAYSKDVVMQNDVIEATIENVDSKLNNKLSDHLLNHGKAKPIRCYVDGAIFLYTDGNYIVDSYRIDYIKKPEAINYYSYASFSSSTAYKKGDRVRYGLLEYICNEDVDAGAWDASKFDESSLTTFPDHLWDEIIVSAVRIALENISEARYQTYAQESQLAE